VSCVKKRCRSFVVFFCPEHLSSSLKRLDDDCLRLFSVDVARTLLWTFGGWLARLFFFQAQEAALPFPPYPGEPHLVLLSNVSL